MYGELRRRDELQSVEAAKLFGSVCSSSGGPVPEDGAAALFQGEPPDVSAALRGSDEWERFVRTAAMYVGESF